MTQPFEELDPDQQKYAVDIAITALVLSHRLPSFGQEFFDEVCTQFMHSYELSRNRAKYSLRWVGKELFQGDWEYFITKKGDRIVTSFIRLQPGGNGESGERSQAVD